MNEILTHFSDEEDRVNDCPHVELSLSEAVSGINIGLGRALHSKMFDDLSDEEKYDFMTSHIKGIIGELIVCKYYDSEVDTKYEKYGDWGHDTVISDKQIQIKSSTNEKPSLTVDVDKVYADIFMLVFLYYESGVLPYKGIILGYVTRDELESYEPQFIYGTEKYSIDWRALNLPPKLD